ncbi:MAG TPA: amidohydrolase family protein [Mycobacterium sp.]|nr:amidohydrolase family protein [Mycobacterium sp.]
MRVVDAHVHLWDPRLLRYTWLDGTALDRLIDATTLRAASGTVTDFVVVQADCTDTQGLAEVGWLVEQSAQLPGLRGIVAFAPLERGAGVRDHLGALRAIPTVVGVRRLIQDERPGFAVADRFLEGVAELADFELTFDVCVRSPQLDEVIELVRRTPDVQFVLDHVGKPQIGADPSRWRLQIAELATRRNIVCKLSGLMTEIVSGPTGVEAAEPYLAHALAEFGPDRCLFGSDWPVMTLAATYSDWLDLVLSLVPGEHDRRAVLAGTAERVYELSASATGGS